MKPGTKVLIAEDVRDGNPATGKLGVYEGNFPRSVALTKDGGKTWFSQEYDYELFVNTGGTETFPLWASGETPAGGVFAMVMTNPRIRLEDGSVIWGDECWWGEAENITFEEAVKQTKETKQAVIGVLDLLAELRKEGGSDGNN